jgi:HD-GYP domain-containing protein (c-di-GMP phosphodiesterase class II)
MSLKQLKVFIHELDVGMFVSALDKPWAETPFPIQGFEIKTGADISRVKAYCDYVFVDTEKGRSPLDVASASAAPSNFSVKLDSQSRGATGRSPNSRTQNCNSASFLVKPNTYKKTVELAKEIPAARRVMNNLLGCLTLATRQLVRGGAFNQEQLRESVDDMVDSVIRCPDAFTWLLRLRAKDTHSHDHSVRSSLWATQFGRHIGLDVNELKDLCLATLLKDVGKVKLDRTLLHNMSRTVDEEAEYRSFVSQSVEQLHKAGFENRRVLNIIKFHCERFNGGGFPKGVSGSRIPFLASVAGIASDFDMLCNPREAGDTMSPSQATGRLYELRGTDFAENLVLEFIQSVGLYPAGTIVELTTGDCGMVMEQNAKSRLSPRIAVFDKITEPDAQCIFVDLKNEQQSRNRLKSFGKRRSYDVKNLAIVRDIEPDSFGIEYSLLENLIARPFSAANADAVMDITTMPAARNKGFFSALKERFAS